MGLRQLYKNRSEMYVFYDEKYDSNKKLLICTKMYKKITKQLHSRLIKYVLLLYNHDFILIIISNISKNFEIFNFFSSKISENSKQRKQRAHLLSLLNRRSVDFPIRRKNRKTPRRRSHSPARERAAQLTSAARRRVSFNFLKFSSFICEIQFVSDFRREWSAAFVFTATESQQQQQ